MVRGARSTPPKFTCGASNTTVYTTSSTGAVVAYSPPAATDAISGAVPVVCTPSTKSKFAVGSTTVACSAKDGAGNVATTTFTVKVIRR